MYKITLKNASGDILEQRKPRSSSLAVSLFSAFMHKLTDDEATVELSFNDKLLAMHQFSAAPGSQCNWSGRAHEITLPQVGAPKKMRDGRDIKVYLDSTSIGIAENIGNGSVSAGIRHALLKISGK